jgi:uncharacterized RDD family membrane protein YckC
MESRRYKYAGFWARAGASILDTFVVGVPVNIIFYLIYGEDFWLRQGDVDYLGVDVFGYLLAPVYFVYMWTQAKGTIGQQLIGIQVVDETSGTAIGVAQAIGRVIARYLSAIVCGLGLLWVAFDGKKQSWHDKMAGTIVVHR